MCSVCSVCDHLISAAAQGVRQMGFCMQLLEHPPAAGASEVPPCKTRRTYAVWYLTGRGWANNQQSPITNSLLRDVAAHSIYTTSLFLANTQCVPIVSSTGTSLQMYSTYTVFLWQYCTFVMPMSCFTPRSQPTSVCVCSLVTLGTGCHRALQRSSGGIHEHAIHCTHRSL